MIMVFTHICEIYLHQPCLEKVIQTVKKIHSFPAYSVYNVVHLTMHMLNDSLRERQQSPNLRFSMFLDNPGPKLPCGLACMSTRDKNVLKTILNLST
jgi:hypothetical protein